MKITRPLLAAKTTDADLEKLKYPLLLSPKIDGVRALVVDGKLLSRTMKMIPNRYIQSVLGRSEFNGLDGELVVGQPYDKNLMQQTTSGVMSFAGEPYFSFYVFDRWDSGSVFYDRWESLANDPDNAIVRVPHNMICSYDELLHWETYYTNLGYEGVMLRDPNGRYKQNRSTLREGILLKVKRFHDGEAIVTGITPLERNFNDKEVDERGLTKRSTSKDGRVAVDALGALEVRELSTGVVFSIGSGFTEAERYNLYANKASIIGKIVKYKSFKVGVKDKPRFPIFLGFRSPIDI